MSLADTPIGGEYSHNNKSQIIIINGSDGPDGNGGPDDSSGNGAHVAMAAQFRKFSVVMAAIALSVFT